jgi:alanine racemase
MDQIVIDCGDDDVKVGDEVVLLGRQGDEFISANELAERLDTIAYEIFTMIATRVARVVVS